MDGIQKNAEESRDAVETDTILDSSYSLVRPSRRITSYKTQNTSATQANCYRRAHSAQLYQDQTPNPMLTWLHT